MSVVRFGISGCEMRLSWDWNSWRNFGSRVMWSFGWRVFEGLGFELGADCSTRAGETCCRSM